MALQQDASRRSKICMLVVGKEASTLSTLHGMFQPMSASPLQCCPKLLLLKFENRVRSIFRKKNSTLEIIVSYFGVLHWQLIVTDT